MVSLSSQKNLIFKLTQLVGKCSSLLVAFFFSRYTASAEPYRSLYIASYPLLFFLFPKQLLLLMQEKALPSVLSPVLFSSSVQLDLRADFPGYCLRECALQRPRAGQLLLVIDVIYNRYICLRAFDFGLKRQLSGERIDPS